MSTYNAIDGSVLAVRKKFIDDFNNPLIPKTGFPKVRLLNTSAEMLSFVIAAPDVNPGQWLANLSIPNLNLKDKIELEVKWRLVDVDNGKHTSTDLVIVEPKVDVRDSDIVIMLDDDSFTFILPVPYGISDTGDLRFYKNNQQIARTLMSGIPSGNITRSIDKTTVTVETPDTLEEGLEPYLFVAKVTSSGSAPKTFSYKFYVVNSQIMLGMSVLEDFLNKSRIENVIPELRWTDSDFLNYLNMGLHLFNSIKIPTNFTGINMQGVLFDAWLECSCYYALSAQLLAEGSLAFDFSGQGISLNVDRTPQLEAALGRIESAINDRIPNLKTQLAKQGIFGGDGSVGAGKMQNPFAKATLGLSNSAVVRIRGISNVFIGKRW